MSFYINKKGLDSAQAAGVQDALALKYKTLKESGVTEFTLYTKPVSFKKQPDMQPNVYWRSLFPSACFAMLRVAGLKAKSSAVKDGDLDDSIAVTKASKKATVWKVTITEGDILIEPQLEP